VVFIAQVSCALKLYIKMISEGSCDTEDWSNDAENFYLKKKKPEKINVALLDIRYF